MPTTSLRGTLAGARQNLSDLFRWRQRVTVTDPTTGQSHTTFVSPTPPANPLRLLRMMPAFGWAAYLIGFFAWTADAFDFHVTSIQTIKLAAFYGVNKTKITEAITLTLLLRSVGAVIFGVIADYAGRRWPLVINLFILGLLQVACVFCKTFEQFLAVRSLFGLAMGGIYGSASAMALENIPVEARGLFSGIFQQGYSFGYVLAACVNLGVGGDTNTWPIAFWVGAGLSFVAGIARALFPESKQFIQARADAKAAAAAQAADPANAGKKMPSAWTNFRRSFATMMREHWQTTLYAVILMAWFNFFSHSSQDSYTTFMITGKGLDNPAASRASIVMKTGCCVGGTIIGYLSQWIGRRRAMIIACILCLALIPAWVLPTTESGLEAGGFFLQFMVQGAWGVVPIYLSEISPPAWRALMVGLCYQLGNAISSPSTQIINALSEANKIMVRGQLVDSYGPVMAIATAIIATGVAVTAAVGPENKGARFEEAAAATADESEQKRAEEKMAAAAAADNNAVVAGGDGVDSEKGNGNGGTWSAQPTTHVLLDKEGGEKKSLSGNSNEASDADESKGADKA